MCKLCAGAQKLLGAVCSLSTSIVMTLMQFVRDSPSGGGPFVSLASLQRHFSHPGAALLESLDKGIKVVLILILLLIPKLA